MFVTYCFGNTIFGKVGEPMNYLFEKGKFTESELENAFIELFRNLGYDYVSGSAMHRTFEKVLIEEDLIRFLYNRYRNADLTDLEMKKNYKYHQAYSLQPNLFGK